MFRIGKLPVPIPSGVTVQIGDSQITAKGPKGELSKGLPPLVSVASEDGVLHVKRADDSRKARSMHGLARSLVRNVVQGVSEGYQKSLDIIGVGYRVQAKGQYLIFNLGYSHPIYYEVPEGLEAKIPVPTKLDLHGTDKELVGKAAAEIRSFRPPEPYKGKGIKYSDEIIRRKEGKSGAR
jgi:large subunit ribosomal protein L6